MQQLLQKVQERALTADIVVPLNANDSFYRMRNELELMHTMRGH